MSPNEIFTAIASLISLLLSGGTLAALLQIRSLNSKTMAEAAKLKAEAEQIKEIERINSFRAQIEASNVLSTTYAQRLDTLTDRITKDEEDSDKKDAIIDSLKEGVDFGKQERLKLSRKINDTNKLFNRLIFIVRTYLNYRANCLQNNIAEDPTYLKSLESGLIMVEDEYKTIV